MAKLEKMLNCRVAGADLKDLLAEEALAISDDFRSFISELYLELVLTPKSIVSKAVFASSTAAQKCRHVVSRCS